MFSHVLWKNFFGGKSIFLFFFCVEDEIFFGSHSVECFSGIAEKEKPLKLKFICVEKEFSFTHVHSHNPSSQSRECQCFSNGIYFRYDDIYQKYTFFLLKFMRASIFFFGNFFFSTSFLSEHFFVLVIWMDPIQSRTNKNV